MFTEMKIALLHYWVSLRGGLETRLFNYVRELTSRGHQVTIFCAKADKIPLPDGVKIVKVPGRFMIKTFRLRYWYFANRLAKQIEGHDFDFRLSLGRTFAQDGVLAAGNHLGYLRALGQSRRKISDRVQISLDDVSFQKSKIIYAASEMMRHELVELYNVPKEKIHLLYPPLDTNKFHLGHRERRKELREKFSIAPDKKAFVFVSTGHKRKGLPLLYRIFNRLRDKPVELIVAGSSKSVSDPNIPNVRFIGFCENTEELYAAADYTIHPATYEPFGQIISESVACGTPVLLSHEVGAKELITDQEGIVMNTFEPEPWIEMIKGLSQKTFQPREDFATIHNLSIEAHIDRMLGIWQENKAN